MFKLLQLCNRTRIHSAIVTRPMFKFGGGHDGHHHEINRQKIKFRDEKSGYYLNPNQTARRTMRIIAQFDKVQDPEKVTLNTQWHQMGLNELDTVELLVGIENEFNIEFPDDVVEKFKDVNDAVQYVSRSFWAE